MQTEHVGCFFFLVFIIFFKETTADEISFGSRGPGLHTDVFIGLISSFPKILDRAIIRIIFPSIGYNLWIKPQ